MSREERERALLRIVEAREVSTQAELAQALAREGFEVTQATVSRDMRRLGLVRVPLPGGGHRWTLPGHGEAEVAAARERLGELLRREALSLEPGGPLLAVRTPPGSANAVAVALDEARLPGVTATLAGDDTIFVLLAPGADPAPVLGRLRAMAGLGGAEGATEKPRED